MSEFQDLTGKRKGRLTAIKEVDRPDGVKNRHYWLVRCDCGNECIMKSSDFNRKTTVSCGCYQRENASKRAYEQHLIHGKSGTRLYTLWAAMIRRCENDKCKEYPLYGGRGVSVCKEWRSNYPAFEKWMIENGYDETAPRGKCTIDRIDVNGNYEPSNCRITTQKEQSANKRNNRLITYNGQTKTMSDWATEYGLRVGTLYDRLSYGWPIEDCLKRPLRRW